MVVINIAVGDFCRILEENIGGETFPRFSGSIKTTIPTTENLRNKARPLHPGPWSLLVSSSGNRAKSRKLKGEEGWVRKGE